MTRERRGLSMNVLSQKAGISHAHISNIEAGKAEAHKDMVIKLADALDVDPREALLAFIGEEAPTRGEEIILRNNQKVRIVSREGEPGTPLDVDETALAVLEALARGKQPVQ